MVDVLQIQFHLFVNLGAEIARDLEEVLKLLLVDCSDVVLFRVLNQLVGQDYAAYAPSYISHLEHLGSYLLLPLNYRTLSGYRGKLLNQRIFVEGVLVEALLAGVGEASHEVTARSLAVARVAPL